MRKINSIFIHHSASEFGNAKLINEWHKQQGWSGIGYHFVVLNGYSDSESYKKRNINNELIGLIEKGRDVKSIGSHVKGHNSNSIGICLIHDKELYTDKQLENYRNLTASLVKYYDIQIENVKGHYEVDKNKPFCPSLDMIVERELIKEKIPYIETELLNALEMKYNLGTSVL